MNVERSRSGATEQTHYLGRFSLTSLRMDAMAGLAVALMSIPQGMAYAMIAGLPIYVGLYAGIVPPILASLFGSSRYLITGPTNAIALLTASVVGGLITAGAVHMNPAHPESIMPVVGLLALVSGLILIVGGLLKLGQIIRYVAQSAMTGFLAGAGVLIILGQIRAALGIAEKSLLKVEWLEQMHLPYIGHIRLPEQVDILVKTFASLGLTNIHAMIVFIVSFAMMWGILKYNRRLPAVPITLALVTLAVWLLGWHDSGLRLIQDRGIIPEGLPKLTRPLLEPATWQPIFGGAAALALLAMTEAITIAKGLAAHTGDRLNVNHEMIGQGAGQIAAAFTGAMVPAGSQTRSALNMIAGAQSRLAQTFSGIFTGLIVLALAKPAGLIPIASLAAVIIYSATGLINVREMRRIFAGTRSDTIVLVLTILSTLVLRLDNAIYVGAALSVLTALRRTSQLVVSEMVTRADGRFHEVRPDELTGHSAIVLLQVEGSLYFGAAEELETYLRQVAARGPSVLILRLKRAHHLDMTIAERLAQLAVDLRKRGIALILCGLRPEVRGLLERTGLAEAIGPDNLLLTDRDIFGSVRRAMVRAEELVVSQNGRPVLRTEAAEIVRTTEEVHARDYAI